MTNPEQPSYPHPEGEAPEPKVETEHWEGTDTLKSERTTHSDDPRPDERTENGPNQQANPNNPHEQNASWAPEAHPAPKDLDLDHPDRQQVPSDSLSFINPRGQGVSFYGTIGRHGGKRERKHQLDWE